MSSKIKVMDFLKEVDYNRKKLIDHARANDVEVSDNISLSAITNINTQFGKTEIDEIPQRVPDPAIEGPFDIIWIDYDGTELFKEVVEKGGKATQFTGEPNLYKQFPDILEWSGWSYNGSLDNVYRDVIVYPTYTIKPDEEGRKWNHHICNIDINKTPTLTSSFYMNGGTTAERVVYIDWGDGTIDYGAIGTFSHTYTQSGTYDIKTYSPAKAVLEFGNYAFGSKELNSIIEYLFLYKHTVGYTQNQYRGLINVKALFLENYSSWIAFYDCKSLKAVISGYRNWNNESLGALNAKYAVYLTSTTETGYSFDINNKLEHISLPEGIQTVTIGRCSIGTGTGHNYQYCNTPSKVYIPESATSVSLYAITTPILTIPKNVSSLAMGLCKSSLLQYLYIKSSLITYKSGADSGVFRCSFYEMKNLKYVELPEEVTSLCQSMFYACNSLEAIIAPGVTTINESALSNCYKLKYIDMPNLTWLGKSAFSNCYSLKNIALEKITHLDEMAFISCYGLTNINLNQAIQNIPAQCFSNCSKLTKIDLYNSNVTEIGTKAFSECKGLRDVILPKNLVNIGDFAFYNCSSLDTIYFSDKLQSIGASAFSSCYNLKHADLYNSNLQSISNSAFSGCKNLKEVLLPSNKSIAIGSSAFSSCSTLSNLQINNSNLTINSQTFYYTLLKELILNTGSSILANPFAYNAALQKIDLSNATVSTALSFSYTYMLDTLLLPQDYSYNLSIYCTSILDNLEDIVGKLKDLTGQSSCTLTVRTAQKEWLESLGLLETLTNKNWTLSVITSSIY